MKGPIQNFVGSLKIGEDVFLPSSCSRAPYWFIENQMTCFLGSFLCRMGHEVNSTLLKPLNEYAYNYEGFGIANVNENEFQENELHQDEIVKDLDPFHRLLIESFTCLVAAAKSIKILNDRFTI